ncbi:MBOAT family O-acyltransferase [Cohnella abietis]|uniref:MBOAT family O-acyltransferase n=1 Tax=Cohnella abietis TaxID=2507935 RepID=UPI0013001753|nr:MBOAT family O-acyltransferase [Cohnella abietis]
MVFSSVLFLFGFFPLFFVIYYLTPPMYRNHIILAGSILFYLWGAPSFAPILFISLALDWHLVNAMHRLKDKASRNLTLGLLLALNIGLLVYFKYTNFIFFNLNSVFPLSHQIVWTDIILPIGISFIVFHKISYILDVYYGSKEPTKAMNHYFIYILLFPMSIAGPIIKYQHISDQLRSRSTQYEDVLNGLYRFSIGLFKKVWIADNIAYFVDNVFDSPISNLHTTTAWIAIIGYSMQIYFDFSGYADMAIGLSRMMGFRISENFNRPYLALNISDFWRRWHISLGAWMKSYLYIPLGGNRRSTFRTYLNLWIVFVVSGIWHGASWNFLIWGVIHGNYQIVERIFWLKLSKSLPKWFNIIYTYLLVLIAWVFFRANTLPDAVSYLKKMFFLSDSSSALYSPSLTNSVLFFLLLGLLICFMPATRLYQTYSPKVAAIIHHEICKMALILLLLIFSMVRCISATYSPFIYFRF